MAQPQPQADLSANAVESALRTLSTERDGLQALMDAVANGLGDAFAAAVERIAGARGRVIVSGMGKSGHVARKIAATLRLDRRAGPLRSSGRGQPRRSRHGAAGGRDHRPVLVGRDDGTRRPRRLFAPLPACRLSRSPPTPASSLGRQADICLTLPKAKEACPNGLAPTTSTTMQLALGDALAIALLERRGFTAEHFRVFHPGGKLGAQLTPRARRHAYRRAAAARRR